MVLPFYILHQTVIVIVAYFVVQTGLTITLKYGVTVMISFAVIVFLYELLVSRIQVLKFLFGMKVKSAVFGLWHAPLGSTYGLHTDLQARDNLYKKDCQRCQY
jgi:hypothetical protein